MTEHPGEQFPPDVDPDVEPGFDPYQSEETHGQPDYDTEPGAQDSADDDAYDGDETAYEGDETAEDTGDLGDGAEHPGAHVDPAEVEFGPEFAREPGQEHEHSYEAGSADGGHPLVEETMARLDELRDRPVSEHGEVYADLHERLQSALVEADAEQGDRG